MKEEFVLSQTGRKRLLKKRRRASEQVCVMIALEFILTPENLRVLADTNDGRISVKTGTTFAFAEDERIDCEDDLGNRSALELDAQRNTGRFDYRSKGIHGRQRRCLAGG